MPELISFHLNWRSILNNVNTENKPLNGVGAHDQGGIELKRENRAKERWKITKADTELRNKNIGENSLRWKM